MNLIDRIRVAQTLAGEFEVIKDLHEKKLCGIGAPCELCEEEAKQKAANEEESKLPIFVCLIEARIVVRAKDEADACKKAAAKVTSANVISWQDDNAKVT